LSKPNITVVIASSLDGRIAFCSGGESHLGSSEDKKILNKAIKKVDATLFGSGTLNAHKSTFLIKKYHPSGLWDISIKQPISLIAGNDENFSADWEYFKQPVTKWLISTNKKSIMKENYFDKVLFFNNSWSDTLKILKKNGIDSIALLGGSKLINSFAKENLIDEIKITIVPKIIGGQYTWIPANKFSEIMSLENRWHIKNIKKLKTDELYIHYQKI
tara:strand:+ start:249 stop:899 length:651 start_codon:yes stop_codon:yes gene_type:complete